MAMNDMTLAINTGADFKTIVIACYDKLSKKYRSVNLGARTIAPQLYDGPEDIIKSLERLKSKGLIVDYEIIKR